MSIYLILYHKLNDLSRIIDYLLETHVYMYLFEDIVLVINLLNVLQICHDSVIVNRKGNVLNIDNDLVYRSIRICSYLYLLHYRCHQHRVHALGLYVKLVLLVVQFVQNTFQVSNCRVLRRKVIVKTIVEHLTAIFKHFLI